MADLPDSGWLGALGKVELWVSGAVAAAVGVLLALWWLDVPPFNAVDQGWRAFLAVAGVIATFLFIARLVKWWVESRAERPERLGRRFEKLSEHQRKYLATLYRRGTRNFELHSYVDERWFEELKLWNYIESTEMFIITADSPFRYRVTELAWRRLEALDRAGALPR